MKVAKIIFFSWLSLVFFSAGLPGAMVCISSEGHICFKFEGEASKSCSHAHDNDENAHQHDDQGCSVVQTKCCFNCVDIPLSSGDMLDFLSRHNSSATSLSFLSAEKSLLAFSCYSKTSLLPLTMYDGPNISVQHLQTVVLLI